MECLLYSDEQLKQHCQGLNDKERQDLYYQVLEKAKEAIENTKDVNQVKMLSRAAVAIEETTNKELFNDDHPFRDVNIVTYSPEGNANYLFSMGDSSELYDVEEDREKALCQAVKSDDVELVKHLLIVLLPDGHKEMTGLDLNHLSGILSKAYEELNLSSDMKNYLGKKIKFYSFLCDFEINKDPVELFANRSEPDYEIDKFLLSLIVKKIKEEELLSETNNMIELLKKYERFNELEYKVRRLKSELESGNGKYSTEIIQARIEEREKEMLEIEEKCIKQVDLVDERKRLVKRLNFKESLR